MKIMQLDLLLACFSCLKGYPRMYTTKLSASFQVTKWKTDYNNKLDGATTFNNGTAIRKLESIFRIEHMTAKLQMELAIF